MRGARGDLRSGSALLRSCVRRRWRRLAGALVAALGYTSAALVTPLLLRAALDRAVIGGRSGALPAVCAALAAVGVVRGGCGGARRYLSMCLGAQIGCDLRERLVAHILELTPVQRDRIGTGELISRTSSDASLVETTAIQLPFIGQTALLGVGGGVLMVAVQPLLGLAALGVVAGLATVPVLLARPLRELSRSLQDGAGDVSDVLTQQVHGIRVTRGHGLEDVQLGRARAVIDALAATGIALARTRARFVATVTAIPVAAMLFCVAAGGLEGLHGGVSAGDIVALLGYVALLMGVVPVVVFSLTLVPRSLAAADRIAETLRTRPDVQDRDEEERATLPAGPLSIELRGVTSGYARDRPTLRDVDLRVEAGRVVALVGASGSGKSTVARLLVRFQDPWAGEVLVGGVDVRAVPLRELRSRVSVVFEESLVFSGTVGDNVRLGCPHVQDAAVAGALADADAAAFVDRLPEGTATLLGERGLVLSGGQRQRLALARALVRDSAVLVLDDATSALDPQTQRQVTEALVSRLRGSTVLLIAHRPETLVLADEVVLIEGGRIVARGSHADLARRADYRVLLGLEDAPGAGLVPVGMPAW